MIVIKCKSGVGFIAFNENYIDAEWKLQEAYYKAQGCIIEQQERSKLDLCECEHCQSLEHNFDDLIEEIKNEK